MFRVSNVSRDPGFRDSIVLISQNPQKHRPCCPRGTKFRQADNKSINREKLVRGDLTYKDCVLTLKATTGKIYKFPYTKIDEIDLDNKRQVADLNKWRDQLIRRKLGMDAQKAKTRPHWVEKEMATINHLVRETIRKSQRLGAEEWKEVTTKFNAKFAGTWAEVGEKLAASKKPKSEEMTRGGILKKRHQLGERTWGAIRLQAYRWPEVRDTMNTEMEKFAIQDENDDGEQGKEGETKEKSNGEETENDDEKELDPVLEDESDDEFDDQRPASDPSGSRAVAAR